MKEITCLNCKTIFKVKEEDISDNCCSDECWEKIYAPGPTEEELTGYHLID